ncbi:hypothetical protein E0485_19470 [Paenibacillus albiflavus]|uniref:RsgI N-terminal anti-sigma domain-containing protein n=1 Tax=Paenibacillus albiflavus TaxID=2545760 RepID=A0A4R4E969_9BACL|nr:hypothetical protein [Paenibacillus albiflavus]TCZ74641.1 hypothetical protein E0485_19470 [Paenibacillus albiflavus]
MNNRGIVLEIQDKQIIVLRSTGQIDRIPRGKRICEIGEEIVYVLQPKSSIKGLIIAIVGLTAALTACFFFILKLAGVTSTDEVIAYVSLDVKPSIEMGIDENEIVHELRMINNGDDKWIEDIKYKDQTLENVTAAILDKAEKGAFSGHEGEIIIASSTKIENASISDVVIQTKMKEQVTKHLQQTHPNQFNNFIVLSIAVPDELRRMGSVQGLSMGQYAVYLKSKSEGEDLTFEEIKASTLREFDAKIKGFITMLTSDQALSKAALSELLQDEKAGKLDEDLANREATPTSQTKSSTKPEATPKPSGGASTGTPKPSIKPTQTPTGTAKPTPKSGSTNKPETSNHPSQTPKPEKTPKPTAKPTPKPSQSSEPSDEPSVG